MVIEWDQRTIIVCAVGSLGVLSAILGFSAEGTKLTPPILVYGDACIYPQNPALGLGISAVILLLAAQVIFSVVGGCCGFCNSRSIPSETKRIIGIVCAVVSWISAVIAWGLLIQGAAWNANVVRRTAPVCYYLKDGVFAGAGVLTLAATALGIASYILLLRQKADATAPAAAALGTHNRPGEQSPSADVAIPIARPLLAPPSRPPQHPTTPEAVSPTDSHPQGYRHGPQNQQRPPPPANQGDGSHAPNQQFHQGSPPAGAAPPALASSAPQEPGGIAMGQPQQVQLPQYAPNDRPQYPLPPPAATANAPSLSTTVRQEVARATIRFAGHALEQVFFPNNNNSSTTTAGDIPMATDPTAGDVGATTSDYGNTAVV